MNEPQWAKIKMDAVRQTSKKIKSEKNGDPEQSASHEISLSFHICRLCLGTKAQTNIFEEESEMVSKIQLCCDLEILQNDGLPDQICSSCVDSIETATLFRTTCQENDKILRAKFLSFLHPIVKREFFTDDEIADAPSDNDIPDVNTDEDIKSELIIKEDDYFGDGNKRKKKSSKVKIKRKPKKIKVKKEMIEKVLKIKKSGCDRSHLCTICGKYYEKRSTYHSHLRSHAVELFNCNECNKSFNRKTKLQEHLITHFGVKNIPCDECGKLFASKAYVQRHINKVHKRLRVVHCSICFKQLADNHTLKYHMKTHTGEKDHECQICHKQFTFKLSLQYHMRTHTGERPYSCRYCFKRFSDLKSSTDHEMLHTGETPYKCPLCPKGFAQLSNMKSHFRYNHKGQNINDYPSYKKKNKKTNDVALVSRQIITLPVPPECNLPIVT